MSHPFDTQWPFGKMRGKYDAGATLSGTTWAVNTAVVAAEVFDEETVVIHFDSGRYFSLGGAAPWVWQALEHAASVEVIAAAAPAGSAEAIAAFVAKLAEEGLVIEAETPDAANLPPPPAPWAAPTIEVFSDLAELIALDPVHEVDVEMGWPKRPGRDTL